MNTSREFAGIVSVNNECSHIPGVCVRAKGAGTKTCIAGG
nr:MAG TPA: hypothetical protein [Bacteriophage sp.]